MEKHLLKDKKEDFFFNALLFACFGLFVVFCVTQPSQLAKPINQKPANEATLPTLAQPALPQSSPIKFNLKDGSSLTAAQSFTLEVIPTTDLSLTVYRLEIFYDPQVLSLKNIVPGSFFKNPKVLRKEIDNLRGRADFSVGVSPEEITSSGEPVSTQTLTTFNFQTKIAKEQNSSQSTQILFGRETLLISEEKTFENLDDSLEPITLTVVSQN